LKSDCVGKGGADGGSGSDSKANGFDGEFKASSLSIFLNFVQVLIHS